MACRESKLIVLELVMRWLHWVHLCHALSIIPTILHVCLSYQTISGPYIPEKVKSEKWLLNFHLLLKMNQNVAAPTPLGENLLRTPLKACLLSPHKIASLMPKVSQKPRSFIHRMTAERWGKKHKIMLSLE